MPNDFYMLAVESHTLSMRNDRRKRLPRNRASKRGPRCRSPSPSLFNPCHPPEQLEPFPAYYENEEEWKEWDQWNDNVPSSDPFLDYCSCVQHCDHPVCKRIVRCNRKRSIPQPYCRCSMVAYRDELATNREIIKHLTEEDIDTALSSYMGIDKTKHITIDLDSCCDILQRMDKLSVIHICLPFSQDDVFTSALYYNSEYYHAVSRSVNCLVGRITDVLDTMLSPYENYTYTFEIAKLEHKLKEAMRVETFWWLSQWVFKSQRQPDQGERLTEEDRLREGFNYARQLWGQGEETKSMRALVYMIEDIVELAISMFAWWSDWLHGEVEDDEDEEDDYEEQDEDDENEDEDEDEDMEDDNCSVMGLMF